MKSKNSSSSSPFATQVDVKLAAQIKKDLKARDFEFTEVPYAIFSAKKKGVVCTFYESGKLVVQGKESAEFIEFYLEPYVLQEFSFTQAKKSPSIAQEEGDDLSLAGLFPHIGIDESGKGDFFGPLCVAGVYADVEGIQLLKKIGVRDSKTLKAEEVNRLARQIQKEFKYHIVKITPPKYNELIEKFQNLNHLLAWGHATAIEQLVEATDCQKVIIDQFAHEKVVLTALKRKKIDLDLTQRHRGEEDPVVAAASILARFTFVEGLKQLEERFQLRLPKGASREVIAAGRHFLHTYGREALGEVGKLHFKTLDSILESRSR